MMHDAGGQNVIGIVVFLAIWLTLIAAAVGVGIHFLRPRRTPPPSLPSPLDILERRFAAGELDRDEFDEARARLREHQLDL